MEAKPLARIITAGPGISGVYPEIGYGIDEALAKSLQLAYSAGEFAARPLRKAPRRVVVEFSDGSIIVAWRKGEHVIGVYVEPSKPLLRAQQAPLR